MTDTEYRQLIEVLGQQFTRIDQRFERIDQRLVAADQRFVQLEGRFGALAALQVRIDDIEQRLRG